MIVGCPACQTQFKVDPGLLKPDGRKVRCASCAHVWRIRPDGTSAPAGQFALRAPKPTSQQAPATEPAGATKAATDTGAARQPAPEAANIGGGAPQAGAKTDAGAQGAGASDTASAAAESPAEARAAATAKPAEQAAGKAKPRKGGRRFKIFLLLLCLIVIALFAVAVMTGRFGPGGVAPAPQAPSTGDVAPPAPSTGDVAPPASDTSIRAPIPMIQARRSATAATRVDESFLSAGIQ